MTTDSRPVAERMPPPVFPLLWQVNVERWERDPKGGKDNRGRPLGKLGAPTTEWVYGWNSPRSSEPVVVGAERDVVDVQLLVPPAFKPVGPRDYVTLPPLTGGPRYRVLGYIEDFNHGPFGWQPGGVINLQRVEG